MSATSLRINRINRAFVTLVAFAAMFLTLGAQAGSSAINLDKSTAGHAAGIAINGFDTVAYFTESKPVEGSAEFSAEHDGATWHFASAANRDLFKSDPDRYAPAYGGYCAYALSKGSLAPIDPNAWTIHNDKLYLNYNESIKNRWSKNLDKSIAAGDGNWPNVLN